MCENISYNTCICCLILYTGEQLAPVMFKVVRRHRTHGRTPIYAMPVCIYSNSRNDVPRVAQRYETIAAHTRRRASVLVVFVVFCMHMYSFAGLIRRTPPPTFSDTAITDRHSDTTILQLRAHWVRLFWSIGSEKSFGHVPQMGVEPSTSCVQGEHPIHYARLSVYAMPL